jgi:hypothetical protein
MMVAILEDAIIIREVTMVSNKVTTAILRYNKH